MINLDKNLTSKNLSILASIKKTNNNNLNYDQLVALLTQFKNQINNNRIFDFKTLYNLKSIDYIIDLVEAYSLLNSIKN